MNGARSFVAGIALLSSLVAVVLSLLTLTPPIRSQTPASPPVKIDLSMLITGRGAIGGPSLSHLFDPQMLVVRAGDEVTLRVLNQSNFRHGFEIVGYDVRTKELNGGQTDTITFIADKPGIYVYRCNIPYDPATGSCSPDHEKMIGHLVVIEGTK